MSDDRPFYRLDIIRKDVEGGRTRQDAYKIASQHVLAHHSTTVTVHELQAGDEAFTPIASFELAKNTPDDEPWDGRVRAARSDLPHGGNPGA